MQKPKLIIFESEKCLQIPLTQDQYTIINIGYYKTVEEADVAYNYKALEIHGEFARLNDV